MYQTVCFENHIDPTLAALIFFKKSNIISSNILPKKPNTLTLRFLTVCKLVAKIMTTDGGLVLRSQSLGFQNLFNNP